jgi:hypothetical protein
MSESGQTRSYGGVGLMSGLPSEAEVDPRSCDVAKVPKPAVSRCSNECTEGPLLDHLVGAREHRCRQVEAERLSGLEVEHRLVFRRRLHRQVGGLFALEDAVDVVGGTSVLIDEIRPIGEQAAGGDEKRSE